MINLKMSIDVPKLDKDAYVEQLKKNIEFYFREAAKRFYQEATKRVPSSRTGSTRATGFSVGAFRNLSSIIGVGFDVLPGVGLGSRKKVPVKKSRGKKQFNEFYYPNRGSKVLKTPESGRQFATPSDKIFAWQGNKFTFNYKINITYFNIQEVVNIGRSKFAPWQAFIFGRDAFLKYLRNPSIQNKIFPDPKDFLEITTYQISEKGLQTVRKRTSRKVTNG